MVEKMLKLIGYEQGDGLFFPGMFYLKSVLANLRKIKLGNSTYQNRLQTLKKLWQTQNCHFGSRHKTK